MSVRPGINIALRSTPPSRPSVSDTGTWFVVGTTDAGPTVPTLIRSMGEYERIFGLRQSYSVLYDALDTFFREGGASAYVSRVVGPAAVTASKNLLDAGAAIALVATALGPGATGNGVSVGVRAGIGGGTFVIFVVVNGVEVETSPDLASQSAAILWGQNSSYIRLTLGVSANNPAVIAAGALAGGNDDRVNITDAQWQAAFDRIGRGYGVGQISAPGRVTSAGLLQVLSHAQNNYRAAILDAPDTATVATLQTLVQSLRAGSQRFGAIYWPWLTVTGIVAGTTRSVPPSALVAAKLAINDGNGFGPGAPAAGDNGVSLTALDLSQPEQTDASRTTLNVSGVNVIRRMFGGIRIYGWRALVDPTADPYWVDFGAARTYMSIVGDANIIAEGFMFDKIVPTIFGDFAAALTGMLQGYYLNGDLYGRFAGEAYSVNTGPQVNTPATISNHELHAVLSVRMSEFAEMVSIEIYKKAITEP